MTPPSSAVDERHHRRSRRHHRHFASKPLTTVTLNRPLATPIKGDTKIFYLFSKALKMSSMKSIEAGYVAGTIGTQESDEGDFMETRRHFAVDKLSPQAKKIVEEGFEANLTHDKIADAVKAATGERLAKSSLQRYYTQKWLPERRRLEQIHATAAAKAALEKNSSGKTNSTRKG